MPIEASIEIHYYYGEVLIADLQLGSRLWIQANHGLSCRKGIKKLPDFTKCSKTGSQNIILNPVISLWHHQRIAAA